MLYKGGIPVNSCSWCSIDERKHHSGGYQRKIIALKNHGYKANSFFRHGLDFNRKALKNKAKYKTRTEIKEETEYVFNFIGKIPNDNFL